MQFSHLRIADTAGSSTAELALPLAQLRSLKVLSQRQVPWGAGPEAAFAAAQPQTDESTSHSSSFRTQGLEQLTALTLLELIGSSVRPAGLSALTALQALACDGVDPESSTGERQLHIPALKTVEAELSAAFPQLQRLTKLNLSRAAATPAAVSEISSLQSLQMLELRQTPANSFPALPQGLTHLTLVPNQPCGLTPSNAAGLSKLTALQYLCLSARPFDMSLLTGMRRLRALKLCSTEVAPGQLQVISRLTGLTSLVLNVTQPPQDPSPVTVSVAEAGALTASSQLMTLSLCSELGGPLVQNYASLFPPGRQLLQLTCLVISADFLKDAAAVQQAGSCCPNLRYAKFGKYGREESVHLTEEQLIAEGLTAMSGWAKLRTLRLEDPLQVVPGLCFWQALGSFSALHNLRIKINSPGAEEPEHSHVLCLEGCRKLRHLVIDMRADDGEYEEFGFRSWKLELHSTVRATMPVCLLFNMLPNERNDASVATLWHECTGFVHQAYVCAPASRSQAACDLH